jgi:hypothetical protein
MVTLLERWSNILSCFMYTLLWYAGVIHTQGASHELFIVFSLQLHETAALALAVDHGNLCRL